MSDKLISIIIPVYNVEQYLNRCLDSIVCQNVAEQIEVICLNDGSTDNSLSILQNYKRDYPFIILINQTNIGLGATRNKGISIASGKYLMFVDSDDWIEDKCLPKLLHHIKNLDHEFIEYESNVRNLITNVHKPYNSFDYETIEFDLKEYLTKTDKLLITAWSKLWARKFILDNNIKFKENTRFEDVNFSLPAYIRAKLVSNTKLKVYNYRISTGSITGSKITNEFLNEFWQERIKGNIYWMNKTDNIMLNILIKKEITTALIKFNILIYKGIKQKSIDIKWIIKPLKYNFLYFPGIINKVYVKYVDS